MTAPDAHDARLNHLKSSFLASNAVSALTLAQGQQKLPQEGLQLQQGRAAQVEVD